MSATVALTLLVVLVVAVAHNARHSARDAHPDRGPVNVLYAGSLVTLMQQQLAPAFTRATGYVVSGYPNGSNALASEIKGGTQVGDVFVSASPGVNATLEGARNGNWVSSYQVFGTSALVLGYNVASRFATLLTSEPWYRVVGRSGFLLGRTDPALDPKGVLADEALRRAATKYHEPRLRALSTASSNVFPEATLVGRLQAGQLDAGFFYAVEAAAAHLKTVALSGTPLVASFSVALLHRAPHAAGARAFVKFLFGPVARKILEDNGVTPLRAPVVSVKH